MQRIRGGIVWHDGQRAFGQFAQEARTVGNDMLLPCVAGSVDSAGNGRKHSDGCGGAR